MRHANVQDVPGKCRIIPNGLGMQHVFAPPFIGRNYRNNTSQLPVLLPVISLACLNQTADHLSSNPPFPDKNFVRINKRLPEAARLLTKATCEACTSRFQSSQGFHAHLAVGRCGNQHIISVWVGPFGTGGLCMLQSSASVASGYYLYGAGPI